MADEDEENKDKEELNTPPAAPDTATPAAVEIEKQPDSPPPWEAAYNELKARIESMETNTQEKNKNGSQDQKKQEEPEPEPEPEPKPKPKKRGLRLRDRKR